MRDPSGTSSTLTVVQDDEEPVPVFIAVCVPAAVTIYAWIASEEPPAFLKSNVTFPDMTGVNIVSMVDSSPQEPIEPLKHFDPFTPLLLLME